jgi:death-on-curing protein
LPSEVGEETVFLTTEEVLELHALAIARDGTHSGLLDRNLLESAVATPRQTVGGEPSHPTIESVAAAYWFHLSMNHPFVDGNKRAAVLACVRFLELNGFDLDYSTDEYVRLGLAVASGEIGKVEFTDAVTTHCIPISE